jgi:hypothetical protein
MSPSKERNIRVVLTREIVYQGPESWVRDTLSRRIMGAMQMGEREGVSLIVSATDIEISADLEPDPKVDIAARTLKKLGVKQAHGISYEDFEADKAVNPQGRLADLLKAAMAQQAQSPIRSGVMSGITDPFKNIFGGKK